MTRRHFSQRGARPAALLVLGVTVAMSLVGCARPRRDVPRGGVADLSALVELHPAWPRLRDLDAKIQRLRAVDLPDAPLFTDPPPARLEAVDPHVTVMESRQKAQILELIALRVRRDFEAQVEQLRRQARRNERAAVATASAEIEDRVARAQEEAAREFDARAERYAEEIGRLALRRLGLLPAPFDPIIFPPEDRQRRIEELVRVQRELEQLQQRRLADLAALQEQTRIKLAQLRTQHREQVLTAVRAEELQELASLEERRRSQQAQLEADLERALQEQPTVQPAPLRVELPAERQTFAAQAATLNRLVSEEHTSLEKARAAALATLRRQRQDLLALVEAATRAAASEAAAERNVAVKLERGGGDPRLTAWLAARLRERWGTGAGGAGRRGA